MQEKIFRKISLRVIVILAVVVVAALVAVQILNSKTAELEREINEELSADVIRPVLYEDESQDTFLKETDHVQEGGSDQASDLTSDEQDTDASRENSASEKDDSSLDSAKETADETDHSGADDQKSTEDMTSEEDEHSSEAEKTTEEQSAAEGESEQPEQPQESSEVPKETPEAPLSTPAPSTAPAPSTTPAPTTTIAPVATVAPTTTIAPATTPAPTPAATTTAAPVVVNPTPLSYAEDRTYVTEAQANLFKTRLLQNINSLRASLGLGALTADACLASGASVRANEISSNWSHTRPNGDRGLYVLEGCGGYYADAVNCIRNGLPHSYAMGENLAVSYSWSDYTGTDEEILALADETFQNWVASPTHYENLVYAGYTKIGIGLYVNMDEDIYHAFWTCGLFSNK